MTGFVIPPSRDPDPAEIRRLVEVVLCTTAPGPARALLASWPAARGVCCDLKLEALREASGYFGGSLWSRCQALSAALADFQGRAWPRWQNAPTATVRVQGIEASLLRAVTLGAKPLSADRLHRVLANSRDSAKRLHWV